MTNKVCTIKSPLQPRAQICQISFKNIKSYALIDSGADLSLMSYKLFSQLPKNMKQQEPWAAEIKLQSISGHPLRAQTRVKVHTKIGKQEFDQTYLVVKGLTKPIILGCDFLSQQEACIDFGQRVLIIGKQKDIVPLSEKTELRQLDSWQCLMVSSRFKTHIPPRSMVKVPARFSRHVSLNVHTLVINPVEECRFFKDQPGLNMPNMVVHNNQRPQLIIINDTDYPFSIAKGEVLATAEPCTPQEIYSADLHKETPATSFEESVKPLLQHIADNNQREALKVILSKYAHLFVEKDSELTTTHVIEMKLDTGSHPPLRSRPYRTPLSRRPLVEEHIQKMLEAKVISPSTSEWASPIVIVPKKDGTNRFCVDYRSINKILKMVSYPLPNIDDIWPHLAKAKYFTTLDLKAGYWQVPMAKMDKEKTAFITHNGLFEFNVMPFGLSTAPPMFQLMMDKVLGNLKYKNAIAYLDDIIVYSSGTLDDHLRVLDLVFSKLQGAGLKIKISKCEFLLKNIKFLGHIVSGDGILPDPEKVAAIQEMTAPINVRGVRSFVGTTSYFRRFIKDYAKKAKPLTDLTKKNSVFNWTQQHQDAFDELRLSLTSAPVLAYPDPGMPYKLYTDASMYAVGAVLTQDYPEGERVIHYLSHKLSESQQRWPTIEREMFAIVYAATKLRPYLLDAHFTIMTDHKPLRYMFSSEMKNARVQSWAIKLEEFNCDIQYTTGASNIPADWLSRSPDALNDTIDIDVIDNKEIQKIGMQRIQELNKIPQIDVENIDPLVNITCAADVRRAQRKDSPLNDIIINLEEGHTELKHTKKFMLKEGLLYHISSPVQNDRSPRLQLVIPPVLQQSVISQLHGTNFMGHPGIEKTYDRARTRYYWENMYKDIVTFVDRCEPCRARNMKKIIAPMQEMPIPNFPFEMLALDICGPYPETENGERYVLTASCLLTNFPLAFAIPNKETETVGRVLIEEIIPMHSCPKIILTDRGGEFNSALIKYLTTKLGIHHIRTSPYRPETNGRCERFHRYMVDSLAKLMLHDADQTAWPRYLPCLLLAYRTSVNDTTRFTPFFLLFGRDPILPVDTLLQPQLKYMGDSYLPTMLQRMHKAFTETCRNMTDAREKNKRLHDRKAIVQNFQPGDPVYYYDKALPLGHSPKLATPWKPYFRIIEQTSPVNYVIKDQITGTTKLVHVEKLRAAHPENTWDRVLHVPKSILPDGERSLKEPTRIQPPRAAKLATPVLNRINPDDDPEDSIPLSIIAQRLRQRGSTKIGQTDVPPNHGVAQKRGHDADLNSGQSKRVHVEYETRKRIRATSPGPPDDVKRIKKPNTGEKAMEIDGVDTHRSWFSWLLHYLGVK